MIGPTKGSGMATTAPMAAAIAVRFATGFSNIVLAPWLVYYNDNTVGSPASRFQEDRLVGRVRRRGMKFGLFAAAAAVFVGTAAPAAPVLAPPPELGPEVQKFVHVPAGQIAITHLRIIDGTGAQPLDDQTLLLDGAKIAAVQAASAPVPAGYRVIEGTGETALPGLVGMHNHLFYLQRPNLDASGHSEQP